jgi:hypothetical protein
MSRSYEDLAYISQRRYDCRLLEAYRGTDIVSWHGMIERQLVGMLQDAEAGGNSPNADKLREFLKTWRDNPISGSINVEDLDTLLAATSQLAVDNWKLSTYFIGLRDNLRKIIASEEEMPRGDNIMDEPSVRRGINKAPTTPFNAQKDAPPEPAVPETPAPGTEPVI